MKNKNCNIYNKGDIKYGNYDHKGNLVEHGRARVNGIIMHYVTAGEGEPLLLLHGTQIK